MSRYYGKPCAKHPALKGERWRASRTCISCGLASQRARYAVNPGKWLSASKAWRKANPDKNRAMKRAWNAANVAKERERRIAWRAANSSTAKTLDAAWRKANHPAMLANGAARRARERGLCPVMGKLERTVIRAFYATARRFQEVTGAQYHVDHIIPLVRGGLHHPSNMQVLRDIENLRKATHTGPAGSGD